MSRSTSTREARRELQRLYLGALTASVEGQVERHRAGGHRLRLLRAEQRLAELRRPASGNQAVVERAAGAETPAVTETPAAVETPAVIETPIVIERSAAPARPLTELTAVTLAWLAAVAILGVCVAMNLDAAVTGLADLVLLALTLIWFLLAVACAAKN
jgi:hypothetical protein